MKRIVNVKRFIISNLVLFVSLFIVISTLINTTYSCTNPKYKTIYAESGDTLWTIASTEKEQNELYKNKDVRDIVIDIKKANSLDSSNLQIGQKLLIPVN